MNWQQCLPVHKWLFPAIGDYMRARDPYASERRILQSLEPDHGLDDRRAKSGAKAQP